MAHFQLPGQSRTLPWGKQSPLSPRGSMGTSSVNRGDQPSPDKKLALCHILWASFCIQVKEKIRIICTHILYSHFLNLYFELVDYM